MLVHDGGHYQVHDLTRSERPALAWQDRQAATIKRRKRARKSPLTDLLVALSAYSVIMTIVALN